MNDININYGNVISLLILAAGPYAAINEGVIMNLIVKPLLKKLKINIDPMPISLLTGIIMAFILNIDFASEVLSKSFGVNVPYVGLIISGLFIGRVANFLHDSWPQKETIRPPDEVTSKPK